MLWYDVSCIGEFDIGLRHFKFIVVGSLLKGMGISRSSCPLLRSCVYLAVNCIIAAQG